MVSVNETFDLSMLQRLVISFGFGAPCINSLTYQLSLCLIGKRRVWHSGSISTYKAHVWLYPDAGIGIFAGLAGPQRYDTTDVLFDLMHAISDLVVFGIRPPALKYSPTTPRPDTELGGYAAPRPLTDYVGTYIGQWSQINATVMFDQDAGVLRVAVGRMLTAELRHYDCADNEFDAVIDGRLWWVAEGVPQRAVLPVRFRSSTTDGRPHVLLLPLEINDDSLVVRRYRFTRPGVNLANDWTARPQDITTCAAARFNSPQAWMLLPVIFQLFIF